MDYFSAFVVPFLSICEFSQSVKSENTVSHMFISQDHRLVVNQWLAFGSFFCDPQLGPLCQDQEEKESKRKLGDPTILVNYNALNFPMLT